jgi:hypothetical protein
VGLPGVSLARLLSSCRGRKREMRGKERWSVKGETERGRGREKGCEKERHKERERERGREKECERERQRRDRRTDKQTIWLCANLFKMS